MTRFNYLGTTRTGLRDRMLEIELSPASMRALVALGLCCLLAVGTVTVERVRLASSQAALSSAIRSAADADARARIANASLQAIRRLAQLARDARAMRGSGAEQAAIVADIGDRLPAKMWIAKIQRDRQGITVAGEALDYGTLAAGLAALEHGRFVGNASLRSAQRVQMSDSASFISYALHVRSKI